MNKIKYPDIKVKLSGENGNAFNILAICGRAMKNAGLSQSELSAFWNEATSGDYNKLLSTTKKWFNVE